MRKLTSISIFKFFRWRNKEYILMKSGFNGIETYQLQERVMKKHEGT